MRRWAMAAALALLAAGVAGATQGDFCRGFAEGYRSVRGEAAAVPACPAMPRVPDGSDAFREGLKAGIRVARAQ